MKIYRDLYFHWIPICIKLKEKNSCFFLFDLNWFINDETQKKNEAFLSQNKKIIILKHLDVNKRKRIKSEKTKLNPKETLIGCLKSDYESISLKSLLKTIINILLNEKLTESIEKNYFIDEIESKENEEFVIKIKTPLNLRSIKKKIMKDYYDNFDQVQDDILEVINNYKKHDLITNEIFDEYTDLIDAFFNESKNLLKEKDLFEKERPHKIKIKLGFKNHKFPLKNK